MELIIQDEVFGRNVRVYGLITNRGHKDIIVGFDGQHLVETTLEEGQWIDVNIVPCLMHLPSHLFKEFVTSIADYASKKEIKTENENLLKGKLEATEAHLQTVKILNDVQTALFTKLIDKFPKAK